MNRCQVLAAIILAVFLSGCASTQPAPQAPRQEFPAHYSPPPHQEDQRHEPLSRDAHEAPDDRYAEEETRPFPSLRGEIQTGLMGLTAQAPHAPPSLGQETQRIAFHFEKVDIAEVSSQIFGEYLRLNYVLDPTVQGRISFYLDGEFTKNEMFQMITKIYEANNISVVPRNGIYHIQPLQRSASSGLPIATEQLLRDEKGGARPIIVIYRLLYMDVSQAVNTVRFFLTPGRPITTDSLTNSLIFVENIANARSIVEMLKALDVNILREVSMEIVPLQSITPQDAVQSMESLMGKLNLFRESTVRNNLAFIPLINYGGVLVLAQNYELLKTAKYWLTAIDVQGLESGEQINVYFVQNGLARDIADILSQVYGLRGGVAERRLDQRVVPSAARPGFGTSFGGGTGFSAAGRNTGNSAQPTFGGATAGSGATFGGTAAGTSAQSPNPGAASAFGSSSNPSGSAFAATNPANTGNNPARAGMVTTGRNGITTRVNQGVEVETMLTGEVMIIPDEVNNAIVIRANAPDYARIKRTIEQLDILPRAVLIEVLIAEVTLTKDLQYGLEWFFKDIGMDIAGKSGRFTAAHGLADLGRSATSAAAGGLDVFWGSVDGKVAALISLLATKTDVNVLSTPTLLATDNKEASIQVGGREPIPGFSALGGETGGTLLTSIQYAETGIILNVRPHITAGGLVRMEVEQTIRRTDPVLVDVGGTTAPRFTERNIKTTLLAHNESTVVIGGIIQQTETQSKRGIPLLGDLPIISPLFASRSKAGDRTELIIAITPHVVEHRETAATREFVDKLRQLQRRIGG